MRLIDQLHQVGLLTKVGVQAGVVDGVILVVGLGLKDGGEVQGVDAQLLQVRQLLGDAGQVSPHKIYPVRLAPPGDGPLGGELRFSVAEALREDLVKHRAVHPGGRLVHINRIDKGKLEVDKSGRLVLLNVGGARLHQAVVPVKPLLIPFVQNEIIGDAGVFHLVHTLVVIEQPVGASHLHGELLPGMPQVLVANDQARPVQVALGSPQADLELLL